jgi:fluoroquinolone transport system permease protein
MMKHPMQRTLAFIKGDYLSIWRDSMMMVMFISPILMGLGIRIILPYFSEQALRLFNFDITPYLTGVAGFFILIPPLMYGLVAGFLILDERDEGVLQYLTVTPLSRGGYLVYRMTMPAIAGVAASALFIALCDLVPYFTLKLIPLFILGALNAPLISLLMATYARDKVEALTMAKAASISFLPAIVIFITDSPLQFICGITPSFWAVKAIISLYANDSLYLLYVAAGIMVLFMYGFLLVRKFSSKVL